jgi:hypothetical protein
LSGSRVAKNGGNLEWIIDWKMEKERIHSEGLCEYRRIILKCILSNCIRMDFDYSFFGRALSDILMNFVINCTFHKVVVKILIS